MTAPGEQPTYASPPSQLSIGLVEAALDAVAAAEQCDRSDPAESRGLYTASHDARALLLDHIAHLEAQAVPATTPAPESRREWRVWLRQRPKAGTGPCGEPHDNPEDADDHAAELHDLWPRGIVEIEEREITTRVVSRRTVPRTTNGEGV